MLLLLALLQTAAPAGAADSIRIREVPAAPEPSAAPDSRWGAPQVTLTTRQGQASLWLLRAADTFFVVARVPDRSPSWADALTICLDLSGDRSPAPEHDDFELVLRRALDSSLVYRGRNGRWQPPLDDPDWRVGPSHAGGGWEASSASDSAGWLLVLRLDPAWFAGEAGRRPGIAFILYDDDPSAWYGWPMPSSVTSPVMLDRAPGAWAIVAVP